jgi:hypothetical protein
MKLVEDRFVVDDKFSAHAITLGSLKLGSRRALAPARDCRAGVPARVDDVPGQFLHRCALHSETRASGAIAAHRDSFIKSRSPEEPEEDLQGPRGGDLLFQIN